MCLFVCLFARYILSIVVMRFSMRIHRYVAMVKYVRRWNREWELRVTGRYVILLFFLFILSLLKIHFNPIFFLYLFVVVRIHVSLHIISIVYLWLLDVFVHMYLCAIFLLFGQCECNWMHLTWTDIVSWKQLKEKMSFS